MGILLESEPVEGASEHSTEPVSIKDGNVFYLQLRFSRTLFNGVKY
jgi:hypothetical protein